MYKNSSVLTDHLFFIKLSIHTLQFELKQSRYPTLSKDHIRNTIPTGAKIIPSYLRIENFNPTLSHGTYLYSTYVGVHPLPWNLFSLGGFLFLFRPLESPQNCSINHLKLVIDIPATIWESKNFQEYLHETYSHFFVGKHFKL